MKLIILYKKSSISANVLGKAGKEKELHKTELFVKTTTFVWGSLWLLLSLFQSKFLPIVIPLNSFALLNWIGIFITAAGVSIFIIAIISMKTSWRVGIDKSTKTELITSSVYKYSRNPAFVGFDLMFIGVAFTYTGAFTIFLTLINIFAIHNLILQEEKHLKAVFGNAYIKFMNKTPRYIFFK
jgi:protein-S-isoprenylcysteine O-methyltransferase Ste14